jgi:outer membrane lipoprotein-sorting protein
VRFLRTLSTTRLIALVALLVVVAGGSAALAVAASRGGGATPPPKPLAQALHDALAGPKPDGITAHITFTNKLFPSGALTGAAGSALLSGATGRLWATNDGHGRLELQSNAGDVQIVWSPSQVTAYDASSNTVYRFALPADTSSMTPAKDTPPSLTEITSFLGELAKHATVSGAQPDNVGTQPAYDVRISPAHDGGLLGAAELAFDAANGIPLRLAIYAQGSSTPALALEATNISYGPVDASTVDVAPPAGAKVVDLSGAAKDHASSGTKHAAVTGRDAVQAAVSFPVVAPDTLVGLPLRDVRLVGGDTALVVYGQGLGAIAVFERSAGSASNSTISGLPTVSLNGVTAQELATQLGTVLEWRSAGTSFVLAGSLPPAAAESAARELK